MKPVKPSATHSFQQITNFDGIDTQWSLTLLDEEGETVGDAQTLRFNDAGDLTLSTVGINGLSLNFTEFTQNVEAPKRITLDAGESSPASPIVALHINEDGYLTAHYDNGETLLGPKLALVQKTGDAITDLALNFGSAGDFSQVTGFSSSNSTYPSHQATVVPWAPWLRTSSMMKVS